MKDTIIIILLISLCSCGFESEPELLEPPNYRFISGKKICIDPGHQQTPNYELELIAPNSSIMKDKCAPGTKGTKIGISEYAVNLEIALKLKCFFENYGAIVYMTRETNDVNISNIERAEIGNSSQSDIMIRLHADGSTNDSTHGISILVPGSEYIKDYQLIRKSVMAASYIIKYLVRATGAQNRGIIERNDLSGFNWSKIPVILIEMGFLTNIHEDILLNTTDYQDKIAAGIIDGLAVYFSK